MIDPELAGVEKNKEASDKPKRRTRKTTTKKTSEDAPEED
jgi:hypothetical protein